MRLDDKKIIEFLNNNVGKYISASALINKTNALGRDIETSDNMYELENELYKIANENGFTLSMSHHNIELLGLSWNIDFKIIRNSDANNPNVIIKFVSETPFYKDGWYNYKSEYVIYDLKENNIRVLNEVAKESYTKTIPYEEIEKIKQIIIDINPGSYESIQLDLNENTLDDGSYDEILVYYNNQQQYTGATNLFLYDPYDLIDTLEGAILEICKKTNEILDKYDIEQIGYLSIE